MDRDDVTLGELARRLGRLEVQMQASFKAIDDRLSFNILTKDYYMVRHDALIERVERLEAQHVSNMAWRRNLYLALVAAFLSSGGAIVASVIH